MFAGKSKTNVLLESLLEGKAKRLARVPETLLEHERQLKIGLAFYEKCLFEEQVKGNGASSTKIALWQDKVFEYKQEYDDLLNKYEREYPEYYNLRYAVKTTSSKDIQNKILGENSALVEYFIGERSILIFTITKRDFDVTKVKKDARFDEWVKSMRTGLLSRDYDLYTKNAYQLFQTLIAPIETKIQNKKLLIIPDGILGYIPFETLITDKPKGQKDYRFLPYLIKDYQITYSYSANLLLENLDKEKVQSNREYIGFAPVVFN